MADRGVFSTRISRARSRPATISKARFAQSGTAGWASRGMSFLAMALFYLILDVWGLKKCAFGFIVIGMNSIVVYFGTEVFDFG